MNKIISKIIILFSLAFIIIITVSLTKIIAQPKKPDKDKILTVEHFRFVGNHGEESMWSALYGAQSGKIYIGLCTHAESAHFYEFDPVTEKMRHIVDLSELHHERGAGINTNGKIHVRMGEDNDGNIYFASLNEDTGPEGIDPDSYPGAFWYRYNPKLDKVEVLSRISKHWGLLGFVVDAERMRLYGLAENGHLYMFDIENRFTRDLGRVDDWDICRTIFMDDQGNIYGSYPVGKIWKYDPAEDRVKDLPGIRLPRDHAVFPKTMSKPMIGMKLNWRVIEWDPIGKVAYGILGENSGLFRFDPHNGKSGSIEMITRLSAPQYWESHPRLVPFSTLALTISNDRKIYYAPVGSASFDYVGNSWDVHDEEDFQAKMAGDYFPPVSYLVTYDIKKKEKKSHGMMVTSEGNLVYGMGGACTGAKDGKIYFVGAIEEKNEDLVVGEVGRRWPYSMGMVAVDPKDLNN